MNLGRLRKKLRKLAAGHRIRGEWASYTETCTYSEETEAAKRSTVREFLERTTPARVLDLGCNTGEYSRLAADCGAEVVAVDSDHDAVERLYRDLGENRAPITPMVIDLANPTPATGYMNTEREAFFRRAQADCVLALALLHHLVVSANLSLEAVRDMLFALTHRDLILEFVPTRDEMFRKLLQFRVDLFSGITLPACREVFGERFDLLSETSLAGSDRTLLIWRKRA